MRTKTVLIVLAFCCFQTALTSHFSSKESRFVKEQINKVFRTESASVDENKAYVTNYEVVLSASEGLTE